MPKQNPAYGPRFDPKETVEFKFHCTKKMRQRIRELANAMHISNAAVVILALTNELERHEEKMRVEKERERREKEEQREKRRVSLLPQPLPIAPDVVTRLDPSLADEGVTPNKLYNEHAKRIAEVLDGDVRELRLRRDEAITAIKKLNPLTHPPEQEIVAKLEKMALQEKAKMPSKKEKEAVLDAFKSTAKQIRETLDDIIDSDDEDVITIK